MLRGVVWALALVAASAQAKQDSAQGASQAQGKGQSSNAFDRACIDLLEGKTPQGEKAITALKDACSNLMAGRAQDKIDAEARRRQMRAAQEALRLQAQGRVQPSQSTAQPQQGQDIPTAFGAAAGEMVGTRKNVPLGMRSNGRPVDYLLVTNPVSWFTGLGVNATIFGAIGDAPKFSWSGALRYSATDTSDGSTIGFGAMGGLDYFFIGQHNEGLRLGPRLEIAGGRERFSSTNSTDTFGRLGLAGELGYNFIASNGVSALAAVGLGGRVTGSSSHNNFSSFIPGDFGPYVSLGIGFGW
jgi:hypothetical protein